MTYKLSEVSCGVRIQNYLKNDLNPWNDDGDIKKNQ